MKIKEKNHEQKRPIKSVLKDLLLNNIELKIGALITALSFWLIISYFFS